MPYVVVWLLKAFCRAMQSAVLPTVTGLPFVESWQSWVRCLDLQFQTWHVGCTESHIYPVLRNWRHGSLSLSLSVCIYLYVCQSINFQWEIQLSSRLDCLIWQISLLSPCRQASWEARLLLWRSIDNWEIQLSNRPSISDQCTLYWQDTKGPCCQRPPVEHAKRTQRDICLKKYLSAELAWGYLTHCSKSFAKETILF